MVYVMIEEMFIVCFDLTNKKMKICLQMSDRYDNKYLIELAEYDTGKIREILERIGELNKRYELKTSEEIRDLLLNMVKIAEYKPDIDIEGD